MRRAGVAIAAVLAVAGCSDAPDHGTVTGHDHQDAWVQYIPGQPPMCSGNPPVCTAGTPGQVIPWPETWSLRIDDGHDSGWRDVGREAYDRCRDGQLYPQCEATR